MRNIFKLFLNEEMMAILSIQSHVCYGYVGNRAATYPLQSLGYDVWAVNTVQFSNHTGYGSWKGEVFSAEHVHGIIQAIKERGVVPQCQAILSGYLGDASIGKVVLETVDSYRSVNPKIIYLCDPVMGDTNKGCFVRPEIPVFFKENCLQKADIITPNHYEAEILFGNKISNLADAKKAANYFHEQGVSIVVIKGFQSGDVSEGYFGAYLSTPEMQCLAFSPAIDFEISPNGTGDLFSALYLGHYLHELNPIKALEQTLNGVYQVVRATYEAKQRELKLIRHYGFNEKLAANILVKKL